MGNEPCVRIGELLVRQGDLTPEQVQAILDQQSRTGRPFGDLAERLFDVSPKAVEQAWIEQYVQFGNEVDLDIQHLDIQVLQLVNRRQAWQFRVLPLYLDQNEVVAVTCREALSRALNFACRNLEMPMHFMIARRPQLEQFLMRHYPFPGADELPLAS